ncbi:MAG: hypothetical protein HQK86_14290 [Nitrospinae bacterium]|nr:hypothetical protein [Nitrospinota bacterium]
MTTSLPSRVQILTAIINVAKKLGRPPSRREFQRETRISENQVSKYFANWNEAVRGAGLEPDKANVRIEPSDLLEDWGKFVRRNRCIPTFYGYRKEGKYSPDIFKRKFGAWSKIPGEFRKFAESRPDWADVLAIFPSTSAHTQRPESPEPSQNETVIDAGRPAQLHKKLAKGRIYGNHINFRGLRHEPVNENGVIFLFGMVAGDIGYSVESVQAGFPDCEAKRQVARGKWERVQIEFEYESRNFRDHGHPLEGCDIIVCWRHNWADCPSNMEVVELSSVIKKLLSDDEKG